MPTSRFRKWFPRSSSSDCASTCGSVLYRNGRNNLDPLGRYIADAILGIDTLWGGDVMCPSGTGRFIADSWFSDEPLPPAYTTPSAARLRETGGVSGKAIDRKAVDEYLRAIDIPAAIGGVRHSTATQPALE